MADDNKQNEGPKTWYAWSTIKLEDKVIEPGDTVSRSDLGLDKEQWKQLVDSRAIRTLKHPDMPSTYQGSPMDFLREQAAKAELGEE